MPDSIKRNFHHRQYEALTHEDGPALILAGPGSGKTAVLTARICHLIQSKKVPPSKILVITYTKAAALSMERRFLRERKGEYSPVVFGTFHAICYHILKEQHLIKSENQVTSQNFNFDALLTECLKLLKNNPEILRKWQERFLYILVDEFQDCNAIQYELLKLIGKLHENLFVVGDDDQAIYGFRGASPHIMQQFLLDFPTAKQVILEANYRSNKGIVDFAGQIIRQNKNRFQKNSYAAETKNRFQDIKPVSFYSFMDKKQQYEFIKVRIAIMSKRFPYEEMAVICRSNYELLEISTYLQQGKIPFVLAKKGEESSFIFHDMEKYFLLATGEKLEVGRMKEALQTEHLHEQLKRLTTMSPYLAIGYIRKMMGYEHWLLKLAEGNREQYEEWKAILDEMQGGAKEYKTIKEWLLFAPKKQMKKAQSGVALLTMHGAKGLEFSYVCIPSVNEGNIPHGKMLDEEQTQEERRLFYVGVTRTKTALDVLYLTGAKNHQRLPSRFIMSMIRDYSSSESSSSPSTNSSNSCLSKNSSNASETSSYSSSLSI